MPKHTVQYALTDAVDAIRSDVEKVVLLDRREQACVRHTRWNCLLSLLLPSRAKATRIPRLSRWAEIGDSGATELASALRSNENLEVLILGSQNIGPAGAQVRVGDLCTNCNCRLNLIVEAAGPRGGRSQAHEAEGTPPP